VLQIIIMLVRPETSHAHSFLPVFSIVLAKILFCDDKKPTLLSCVEAEIQVHPVLAAAILNLSGFKIWPKELF
jgi:hypothetical protein